MTTPTRRHQNRTELFGETYPDEPEFLRKLKLHPGKFVLGRMSHICKHRTNITKEEASLIVARELRDDWIEKNVYPAHEKTVARKILRDYETLREMRKTENRTDRSPPAKWFERANGFNSKMVRNAYDIRSGDQNYESQLSDFYGVQMTAVDVAFYEDNCNGAYIATCTPTVPKKWMKQKKRRLEREIRSEGKVSEMKAEAKAEIEWQKTQFEEAKASDDDMLMDPDYELPLLTDQSGIQQVSSTKTAPGIKLDSSGSFPSIPVRTGKNTMNEIIMRCLVHCSSKYKVTTNDLLGLTADIANQIFGQGWTLPHSNNIDHEYEMDENNDDDDEYENGMDNRKRKKRDFTYVLPSRKCISNYIQDATYLNLAMVAKHVINAGDSVVTVGLDDTTKAAGFRVFDVKTDHLTITSPEGKRATYTTGYTENASHSGSAGAEAVRFKLECLALLADTTTDDIMANIHFWMTDRASDCASLLDDLGVDKDNILKCCAHLLLCIDHSIEKTFKDTEQRADLQKLIKLDNILRNSQCSLHTTGLIALAKLISPSHAAHSVSLYTEFKDWLRNNDLDESSFSGFVSNRFGRVVELAREFLKHRDNLLAFFESVVDENANKLVLAVHTFITNAWFLCCNEVYSLMGQMVIYPLMDLLGIDGCGPEGSRRWADVKSFFAQKLLELERRQEDFSHTSTGKGQLISAVLIEVIEGLKRQLSQMEYFNMDTCTMDMDKLQLAPLTNLGCESEFSKLSSRVKYCGGMTSMKTHSNKNIISTNGFLFSERFIDLDEDEKRVKWKWARRSEQVMKTKKLENEFIQTIKAMKRLALVHKEEQKKKKIGKMLTVLDTCKKHGGPVTPATLELIERLNERQLLSEISYLRLTVFPDIRQKRRMKLPNGRYKFQTYSLSELRLSIRTAMKPDNNIADDLDLLIREALKSGI